MENDAGSSSRVFALQYEGEVKMVNSSAILFRNLKSVLYDFFNWVVMFS